MTAQLSGAAGQLPVVDGAAAVGGAEAGVRLGAPATPSRAKPVLRWVGGKGKLLPELLARMPASYGRYYEPFVGGGALFFRVAPERAVLGDANAGLINLYRQLARDPRQLIDRLHVHAARHAEAHYLAVRAGWNLRSFVDDQERAAAFLYLVSSGFNGLWRENRRGENNVAWGKHASYAPDVDNLRAAAVVLARAELRAGDFRATLWDAAPGDFVYLDPTYDPASKTANFSAYTAEGSDHVDQAVIAYEVRKLADRGVMVMLSNANTQRVRDLYAGLRIDVVHAPRSVNRDGDGRGLVEEVIVTAGYEPCAAAIAQVAAERAAAEKLATKSKKNKKRAPRAKEAS